MLIIFIASECWYVFGVSELSVGRDQFRSLPLERCRQSSCEWKLKLDNKYQLTKINEKKQIAKQKVSLCAC